MLLSLGLGWPVLLQGLNNFNICPLIYLWCHKSWPHSRPSVSSQSGQGPDRLQARSEACSALSLKPKQDYFFNFPNTQHVPRREMKTRIHTKTWALMLITVLFSLVQSLGRVQLFATPWMAACQVSMSIINTNSIINNSQKMETILISTSDEQITKMWGCRIV